MGQDPSETMAEETDRMEGVKVSDMDSINEELSFPVTADEIVEEYGDHELDRTNADPISLRELFEPMGNTEFHSADDLETMIVGQMPQNSEGRTNYSDRGGSHPVETEEAEEAGEQTAADLEGDPAADRENDEQEP